MMKQKYLILIGIILIPLILYLGALTAVIYNINFYNPIFEKSNSPPRTAEITTLALLEYFQTDEEYTDIALFTENEVSHLKDVKNLLNRLFMALPLLIIILGFLVYNVKDIRPIFYIGGIITIIIPLILSLIPFYNLFYALHLPFFSGNFVFPANSWLIILYPTKFFQIYALKLSIIAGISGLILSIWAKLSK